ncbi:hypothetical protein K449DRAFT_433619 [Hypoxylon sp. EC38]|nr:hypothetical protein K449DRAFT_433619 [Hypoxylon sp. EC38]
MNEKQSVTRGRMMLSFEWIVHTAHREPVYRRVAGSIIFGFFASINDQMTILKFTLLLAVGCVDGYYADCSIFVYIPILS